MLTYRLPPAATVAVLSLWSVMYNKLSMVGLWGCGLVLGGGAYRVGMAVLSLWSAMYGGCGMRCSLDPDLSAKNELVWFWPIGSLL